MRTVMLRLVSVGLLLAACSAVPSLTVQSEKYPGVRIECRSDVPISADGCRAWADQMLDIGPSNPNTPAVVNGVVLDAREAATRCSATFYGANNRLIGTGPAACPHIPGRLAPTPASPAVVEP
jgi:uncharacterized protein YceK